MGQRLVLTGGQKEIKTKKTEEYVDSVYTKKTVKTLPFLSENEKISEHIFPPFLSLNKDEFHHSEDERVLLKKLKREVSNRHPKTVIPINRLHEFFKS